jgi:hypothetical protein
MLRDLAHELGFPEEIREMAMAHKVDKVKGAYNPDAPPCDGAKVIDFPQRANEAAPQTAEMYGSGSGRRFMTGSGKNQSQWTA